MYLVIYIICVCIYITAINEKQGHEFERENSKWYMKGLEGEREEINYVILL